MITLIEVVPTRLEPDRGNASVGLAMDTPASPRARQCSYRHARGAFVCGALLFLPLLLAGWTSAWSGEARTPSARKQHRAEAEGGNPAFYEVFGKRYRVRTSSDGYHERGVASWYGHPFHGRPTSSGEMYDMNDMTAAHTTLPLPTWVEVTNLSNGKRIVVKVNDRGPFVGKRMIDLSYAAASALDIVGAGTARVEVRALDGPPTETVAGRRDKQRETVASTAQPVEASKPVEAAKPAKVAKPAKAEKPARAEKPAKAERPASDATALTAKSRSESHPESVQQPPPSAQPERLFAQAGRFTNRADAVELVDALRAQGFVNAFVVTEDNRCKSLHRVRVGPLLDAAEVDRMSDELRGFGAKRSRSVAMR